MISSLTKITAMIFRFLLSVFAPIFVIHLDVVLAFIVHDLGIGILRNRMRLRQVFHKVFQRNFPFRLSEVVSL